MMLPPPRRVVVARAVDGRSAVTIDGPAAPVIWSSDRAPADNDDPADQGGRDFTFTLPPGGSQFFVHDFPPGETFPMHASNTLDYGVIVSGAVTLVTETGEAQLAAGDVVVDRGVVHAWRNDTDQPCRLVMAMVAAHPVGSGAQGIGAGS